MMKGALLAAAALAAASHAAVPQRRPDLSVPPYQGVYQPQGVDERGLWMEADEHERQLRDSNLVIRDAALNDYVRGVLCQTVGEDRCRNVRIYIVREARPNAYMAPNGMMVLWSGFLLRFHNEAELASILGHEFAHFERRHGLTDHQRRRTASDVRMWLTLLGAAAGVSTSAEVILTMGAYYRFNRNQEREADILGLSYLKRSTYRPRVASDVFARLMDEADASALGRAQRSGRYDRVAFFASHPTDLERATYLRELAPADVEGRSLNSEAYATAMRPWMSAFIDDQIRLNDFGGSEYLLGQLASGGWTADLLFARGELYRMRGNPRDLVNAADFYRQSIAVDEGRAEAHRGLGLALMRSRATAEGKAALERYLAIKPDAADAPMIRMLIEQPF